MPSIILSIGKKKKKKKKKKPNSHVVKELFIKLNKLKLRLCHP